MDCNNNINNNDQMQKHNVQLDNIHRLPNSFSLILTIFIKIKTIFQ